MLLRVYKGEIPMSSSHWDDSFREETCVYGETPNALFHDKSKISLEQSRVGCFAEGEGRNAVYLAKVGHQVTAYDQSTIGLDKTEDLAHKNDVQVETIAMDLTKEKGPTKQFDAAIMVFGH